jgi:hypothetical protein
MISTHAGVGTVVATASGVASTPETSPVRVGRVLAAGTCFLSAAGAAVVYLKYVLGHDTLFGLVRRFDLDAEMNVPSWFSSALLFVAAAILGYIAVRTRREGDRFASHWTGLAWIFLLMSLDETAGLHGLMTRPVRGALHLSGAFYYAWVVPMMVALVVFGIVYLKFVWNLPRPVREWMVLSGIVYVSGALGGELVEGAYKTAHGIDLTFAVVTVIEETLEMVGATMFIYTLLRYVAARWGEVRIRLAPGDSGL